MSGVGFVMGWVSANSGIGDKLEKGPYRCRDKAGDRQVARRPQGLQPVRRDDAGQRRHAGHAEPRRDRDRPGLGRHVLHVAGRRAHEPEDEAVAAVAGTSRPADVLRDSRRRRRIAALAKKFIDLAESPEVQADGIVKQFNWYPGIDPQYVQAKLDQAAWNKLFTDISPQDLAKYGRPFPLSRLLHANRRRLRAGRPEITTQRLAASGHGCAAARRPADRWTGAGAARAGARGRRRVLHRAAGDVGRRRLSRQGRRLHARAFREVVRPLHDRPAVHAGDRAPVDGADRPRRRSRSPAT